MNASFSLLGPFLDALKDPKALGAQIRIPSALSNGRVSLAAIRTRQSDIAFPHIAGRKTSSIPQITDFPRPCIGFPRVISHASPPPLLLPPVINVRYETKTPAGWQELDCFRIMKNLPLPSGNKPRNNDQAAVIFHRLLLYIKRARPVNRILWIYPCRTTTTSPSLMTYSFPSKRNFPFCFACAHPPASSKSFQKITSARMNLFSKSV